MPAWALDFLLLNFPGIRNLNQDNTLSHTEFTAPPTLGAASKQKDMIDAISFYKIFLHSVMDTLDHNYNLFLLQGQLTGLSNYFNFLCYPGKYMCN